MSISSIRNTRVRPLQKQVPSSRFARIFLGTLIFFVGCESLTPRGLEPGAKAPNVKGLDLASKPFELSALSGKVILLNFWATWCGPCVAELPALQKLHDRLKDNGFTVLAVAVDDVVEDVTEYKDRYNLTFPILVDEDGKSKQLFKIQGVPESFLLDKNQKVIFVTDPETGEPVTKIIGPRAWDTPQVVSLIKELLQK